MAPPGAPENAVSSPGKRDLVRGSSRVRYRAQSRWLNNDEAAVLRRRAATVMSVTLLTLGATLSADASRDSYVVRSATIGSFKTATGGYAQAERLFGGPSSSSQDRRMCVVRWPDGLTIAFPRRLPGAAFRKACVRFKWARMTGRKWHTVKGLRVGSAERQIERLYPQAVRKKVKSRVGWNLVPGLNPALEAWTAERRVIFLRVVLIG